MKLLSCMNLRKILVFLISALVLCSGASFFFGCEYRGGHTFTSEPITEEIMLHEGDKYTPKKDIETFLIIGLDKTLENSGSESYNNNKQADFLLLFVFDNKEKTASAIQINRDTMAEMNLLDIAGKKYGKKTCQIALSHTEGNGRGISCRNTADAVSSLLCDIDIDYYFSTTLESVTTVNDKLGGVEVTVLDDFTGVDDTLIKGEKITLMGKQALTYVRARNGLEDNTNINRMKRQRQYMEALFEKLKLCSETDTGLFLEILIEISEYYISNCSDAKCEQLFNKVSEYEALGIKTLEGENKKGEKYMEFYPDQVKLKELVLELFYDKVSEE